MRKTILFVVSLLFAFPVQAGPINWVKHHKRFLLAAGAVAGASIVQWKGTSYCQRGDVEQCIEGYGSRRAFNGFSIGLSSAMLGAAEGCWKNDGGKICYGLAYGFPVIQTAFGIRDFLSYKPITSRKVD